MKEREVKVKVFPGSKREKCIQNENGTFDVYVREPAQRNLANTRVRERIAEHFDVSPARVVIRTGHRARRKTLNIVPLEY
jgi:uncharacterized protein YggU (UPF0235/DUF167 family)